MKNKIENLLKELNKGLIERENVIKICLLTILTGENTVIVGPPGTAKSEIARRVSDIFKEKKYFEYLLTKFTTPEEMFGPISLKELEKDIFKRNTDGYLPTSKIGFLDEIFKANSSILNSLLSIINEGVYHNGSLKENVDTKSIIGASNELPTNESELYALYDRFLTKIQIDYISNPELLFSKFESYDGIPSNLKFTNEEFEDIHNKSNEIIFNNEALKSVLNIKNKIEILPVDSLFPEKISDRKLMKLGKLLKTASHTSNKESVEILDLVLLKHAIWNNPENIHNIFEIIDDEILNIDRERINISKTIYSRWEEMFNEKFVLQERNEDGELLFFDIEKNKTTKNIGQVHLKDTQGNFLFFKGHREYVTASVHQSEWNLGFVDTGYKLQDEKKIWYYESSSTKVTSSPNSVLEGWQPLAENGDLPPAIIDNFKDFLDKKDFIQIENLSEFKNINSNLVEELNPIREYILELEKKELEILESKENVWISKEEIRELLNKLVKFRGEVEKLEEKFSELNHNISIIVGEIS